MLRGGPPLQDRPDLLSPDREAGASGRYIATCSTAAAPAVRLLSYSSRAVSSRARHDVTFGRRRLPERSALATQAAAVLTKDTLSRETVIATLTAVLHLPSPASLL